MRGLIADARPSHLVLHVSNTSATVEFYRKLFGAEATDDHTFGSPGLDAIFGRRDVRIRSTFIDVYGYRLHTIETLDVERAAPTIDNGTRGLGITGFSLAVGDLESLHERAAAMGLGPTPMYEIAHDDLDHTARMFFVSDPDAVRVELIGI